MSRPMTAQEKIQFKGWFPALDVDAAVVTAESTTAYNCISWTVGVTNVWHWPGSSIQDFDAFYSGFGFQRRPSGPVAVWGHDLQDMLHGSVSGPTHGPRWESKCGSSLRIQHGKDELVSDGYGHIVGFYRRRWFWYLIWLVVQLLRRPYFKVDPRSVRILDEAEAAIDPARRERFEQLFADWKKSWHDPSVQLHSNPAFVRRLPAFEELVALGPEILPAVARKLAEPDNFLALQLYEALQPDEYLKVAIRPGSAEARLGEQGRALKTAQRYARTLDREAPLGR